MNKPKPVPQQKPLDLDVKPTKQDATKMKTILRSFKKAGK